MGKSRKSSIKLRLDVYMGSRRESRMEDINISSQAMRSVTPHHYCGSLGSVQLTCAFVALALGKLSLKSELALSSSMSQVTWSGVA